MPETSATTSPPLAATPDARTREARARDVARRILHRPRRMLARLREHTLVPRAKLEFATHVPVLVAIARLIRARRVLELGCGRYSTLTFLDRAAFPDLQHLHSIEDDAAWVAQLRALVGARDELALETIPPPVSAWAATAALDDHDLIFVDDSLSYNARAETIRRVVARAPAHAVIVIHDFEVPLYRKVTRHVAHRFRMRALNPNVGVIWNTAPLHRRELRRMDELIRRHDPHVATDDVAAWTRVMSELPQAADR